MLVSLSVRDVVLIDRLNLPFHEGLGALTGETGAGKSILLDALGLALGNRAEGRLLRHGQERASVAAAFELPPDHPVFDHLHQHDFLLDDDPLVLRRTLSADGRSRAYINDQPVSVSLLRSVGDLLVEVQGQFEQRGLLDAANHRVLLDAFGGLEEKGRNLRGLYEAWQGARRALREAEEELAKARGEEDFLRHAVEELETLSPEPGEEERLAEERNFLLHAEQVAEGLNSALTALTGGPGSESGGGEEALGRALKELERAAAKAGGRLDAAMEALNRANAELEEAIAQINSASGELDLEPGRLRSVEDRYFALKDAARKHGVESDQLPALLGDLQARLAAIDSGDAHLKALAERQEAARRAYLEAGEALSAARAETGARLDALVNAELPPLKLEKASFSTTLARLEEEDWGPNGLDRVAFLVRTNPGAPAGPIAKIASGGELSRFLLALKVVLAAVSPVETLVFDEVDSGIGGATADAVGERLARLAEERQVLVVTHSPQVAARARNHWQVSKAADSDGAITQIRELDPAARREEVARMLSGAKVTDEARAAADRLMGAA